MQKRIRNTTYSSRLMMYSIPINLKLGNMKKKSVYIFFFLIPCIHMYFFELSFIVLLASLFSQDGRSTSHHQLYSHYSYFPKCQIIPLKPCAASKKRMASSVATYAINADRVISSSSGFTPQPTCAFDPAISGLTAVISG